MSLWPVHACAIEIAAPAEAVFAFMTAPDWLNRWSFGTWETRIAADGLVEGRAIFDGAVTWVRIAPDAGRLSVDYHLGPAPDALQPRICARVMPGPVLGSGGERAVLSLFAWRDARMDELRWARLTRAHEFELFLIKSLIENEFVKIPREPGAVQTAAGAPAG